MPDLPIQSVLSALQNALSKQNTLLIAPPGAGKTTAVPIALLKATWLNNKRIIMLEPRRLAARNAAYWMAHQLKENVGETVGYRTRFDSQVGNKTKIEVVTEGILTRIIQSDPELSNYGLIIFDEFHERNLASDLGLALCLDVQENLREDLRILIMSATLQTHTLTHKLPNLSLVESEGRSFPVSIHYLDEQRTQSFEQQANKHILKIINQETGSILVFLPGAGEIQRLHRLLSNQIHDESIEIYALFGSLSAKQQQQAIESCPANKRKIVIATNLAETSLTIDGIRIVLDTGFARVPRFNKKSGMSSLETQRISLASADQRCGRAGRTAEGSCYRMWSENTQKGLIPQTTAEILMTDLTSLALELAQWGVRHYADLHWLDEPPESHFLQAQALLTSLNALDSQKRITNHGRQMLQLGLAPRLSHMLLQSTALNETFLACHLAALLNERDFMRLPPDQSSIDIRLRIEAIQQPSSFQNLVDRNTLQQINKNIQQLQRKLNNRQSDMDCNLCGVLIAQAFPDRIAQRRANSSNRYLLSNGKGAFMSETDALVKEKYLAIATLDGKSNESKIFLAAPIDEQQIFEHFSAHVTQSEKINWHSVEKAVVSKKQTCLGKIVLKESDINASVAQENIVKAFIRGLQQENISILPWTKALRQWQARVIFLYKQDKNNNFPDLNDNRLIETLENWLATFLMGKKKLSDINSQTLANALKAQLSWEQQQQLDELAPTHWQVPTGSRIAIDYLQEIPVLSVRLQKMFGATDTPKILNNRFPLMLHLLSPAQRPVQITQDINSFWVNSYQMVKKDLKGRYPKHYWPDDPLQAKPTKRAKPRK